MINIGRLACVLITLVLLSACVNQGATIQDKRSAIQRIKNDTLEKLYKQKPNTRSQIASAPGYAVFSNASINFVLASVGGGHGVVKNNRSGRDTYMRMGELGFGFGAGIKDFRIVMVFDNEKAMNRFVNQGWVLGAQADAAAKASEKGGAVGGEVVVNGMTIYQLTESGIALQALIKGAKFWRNASLN